MWQKILTRILTCTLLCGLTLGSSAAQRERSDSAVVRMARAEGLAFSADNSLILLPTGREKFTDLFQSIRLARHSIHLEYFNFRNDSISGELFSLLIDRARHGVKVRIIFDGFGNSSNNRPLRRRHLEALREAGLEVFEFDPMRFPWINHAFNRDHRKITVIDGMIGYTGGMNVADYYITGKPEFGEWRDMHCRVTGTAAWDLQDVFLNMWNRLSGQDLGGAEFYASTYGADSLLACLKPDTTPTRGRKLIATVNREARTSPRIIRHMFVHAIDAATDSLRIVSPYFTLYRSVMGALKRALKRGVKVEVMVSEKVDVPIVPRVIEQNARILTRLGAHIYYYQGGFHHSKVMTVDGRFTYMGSANLDRRSGFCDNECNLLIIDPYVTAELNRRFTDDVRRHCYLFSYERYKQLPAGRRIKGHLYKLLTPFL